MYISTWISLVVLYNNNLETRGQNLKEIYRVSQTKPGHETGLALLSLGLSFVRVSGNFGNSECYGAIPQNETFV